MVNDRVVFTNEVSGIPIGEFEFLLGPGAPPGATVNPVTGVFQWTPGCSQASRTFPVTVWVRDTGNPNLMDAATFTVEVGECVIPELGRLVLQTGDSGRIPVNLISSVALNHLSLTVDTAFGRLSDLTIEPLVPEICTATLTPVVGDQPPGRELFALDLTTCEGSFLIGTRQVAWLHFTTVPDLPSAFVDLRLEDMVGEQPGGQTVRNFAPQAGRLVIIGEEPLLEAGFNESGEVQLTLYGEPQSECTIEAVPDLQGAAPWGSVHETTLLDLYESLVIPDTSAPQLYFRAIRTDL